MKSAFASTAHRHPLFAVLAVVEVAFTLAEAQAATMQPPQIADVLMEYESVRAQSRKDAAFTWTPDTQDNRPDEFAWLRALGR